ncbi:hypothetical protein [Aureibacillus halotolerans]|uniref:Uncharacterized protein n=1 Tax=Aureibacillus halotolerans TaxID=1508390 RepID=A0A4R6UCB1_9BACI|nr:hypothetical protein [Aureibacillus halotolerans]TDQ42733.1 hypothetical protein EV213_101162 [Aureibacillus halotolerans]
MDSHFQKDFQEFIYRRMEQVIPEKQSMEYATSYTNFYRMLENLKTLPGFEEAMLLDIESEVNSMISEGERLMYVQGFHDAFKLTRY